MKDKRMLKRRHLIYYLRLLEQPGNRVVGYLVDITTEGFMMMSETPSEVGKKYKLKLLVNDEHGDKRFMLFAAVCRWCKRSLNTIFYDAGFELENISAKEFLGIRKMIKELGFND
ncbi:MAG: PilZ domain-containing protein [candidate division FCPU426 bacterium]